MTIFVEFNVLMRFYLNFPPIVSILISDYVTLINAEDKRNWFIILMFAFHCSTAVLKIKFKIGSLKFGF